MRYKNKCTCGIEVSVETDMKMKEKDIKALKCYNCMSKKGVKKSSKKKAGKK